MTQVLDNARIADGSSKFRLRDTTATADALALLATALPPGWSVQREIDYVGNVTVIVLPATDHAQLPSFILFEKDGEAHVATVTEDRWDNGRGFRDVQPAVTAIIAAAAAMSAPPR